MDEVITINMAALENAAKESLAEEHAQEKEHLSERYQQRKANVREDEQDAKQSLKERQEREKKRLEEDLAREKLKLNSLCFGCSKAWITVALPSWENHPTPQVRCMAPSPQHPVQVDTVFACNLYSPNAEIENPFVINSAVETVRGGTTYMPSAKVQRGAGGDEPAEEVPADDPPVEGLDLPKLPKEKDDTTADTKQADTE